MSIALCVPILIGCSAISHDIRFDGTTGTSFAMVVLDDVPTRDTGKISFGFQRVDFSKSIFLPDTFEVIFPNPGLLEGNEFKKQDQMITTLRFAGKAVTPGDYALVYRLNSEMNDGRLFVDITCYSLGAVVYRFNAGKINIFPIVDIGTKSRITRASVESQVRTLLENYPNVSAPVNFSEAVGAATFKSAPTHGNKKSCGKPGPLSLIRIRQSLSPDAGHPVTANTPIPP